MSVIASELKFYKSQTVLNGSSNGGKMSTTQITSGVKNNIFPDVTKMERQNGLTRYRKIFGKVANDDDDTLYNGMFYFSKYTQGDDYVVLAAGTQTDTQGSLTGSERWYGSSPLNANVSAGESSLVVNLEHLDLSGEIPIFQTGDKIVLNDGVNEEFHDNVTISDIDDELVTIALSGETLLNGFNTSDTTVSSILEVGDIAGSFDTWSESFAGTGAYDESTNPIELDHIGSIEETWTITFSDSTNFSCSGASVGSVGSGTTGSDFSPTNSDFSKPYFILRAAGWSGTPQNGDTVSFKTHPAAKSVWLKQVVPAGASSQSNNSFKIKIAGESA